MWVAEEYLGILFRDDRLDNLEWCTHSANLLHKRQHGTMPRGTKHHNSRLTPNTIRKIRGRHDAGESQKSIASDLGLSQPHVNAIVHRRLWAHVE